MAEENKPVTPPAGSIAVPFQVTGRFVSIPEHVAHILDHLLDQVPISGAQSKLTLGIAQNELQLAIAALPPLETPRPPNRAQRRSSKPR